MPESIPTGLNHFRDQSHSRYQWNSGGDATMVVNIGRQKSAMSHRDREIHHQGAFPGLTSGRIESSSEKLHCYHRIYGRQTSKRICDRIGRIVGGVIIG